MITTYALLLDRCRLSHREAAGFHKVRLDTVRSWSIGRNTAPDGVIAELRQLYALIERQAKQALLLIAEKSGAQTVEMGLASNDCEARQLGWPCVGAHAAMIGLVAARTHMPVSVVPRASTLATAAAADAHKSFKGKNDE